MTIKLCQKYSSFSSYSSNNDGDATVSKNDGHIPPRLGDLPAGGLDSDEEDDVPLIKLQKEMHSKPKEKTTATWKKEEKRKRKKYAQKHPKTWKWWQRKYQREAPQ